MNRMISERDLKQTVALYADERGHISIIQSGGWADRCESYVQISEPSDIKFKPLEDEEVLRKRVDAIDRQITKVRAELTAKVADLTDQKNRLLAITHNVTDDS